MKEIDLPKIISITKQAGQAILEIYEKDFSIEYKDDKSPLTEADKKSNEIINKELNKFYPQIVILSEENKEIDYNKRKDWDYFWLVDPLDGTKEFIKRNGEFTINIALIHKNEPVLGVVYIPVKNIIYYGDKNGSFRIEGDKIVKLEKKGRWQEKEKIHVVASRSHFNKETKDFIENLGKKYSLVNAGSSLKLCLVAEGKADIYPRLGPTMEWDTAAAHAVVKFAGGRVYDFKSKEELKYNKENLFNEWFIVE